MEDESRAHLLMMLLDSGELPASANKAIIYEVCKILGLKFDYQTAKDIEDYTGSPEYNSLVQCPFCGKPLRKVMMLLAEGTPSKVTFAWIRHMKRCRELKRIAIRMAGLA
jgi:hypothetical protein